MRSALWLCVCAGATLSCVGNIGERGDSPGGEVGDVPPELAGECGEIGPSPMRRLTRWEYDNTIPTSSGRQRRVDVRDRARSSSSTTAPRRHAESVVIEQFEKAANDIAERAPRPALSDCDVPHGEGACVAALV